MRRRLFVLMVLCVGVSGCTTDSPPPRVSFPSPVETATSWFKAIDEHNRMLAVDHFAPSDRGQMDWYDFDSVSFSDVHCRLLAKASTAAEDECTFAEHVPRGDQRDTFWTISMQRKESGPWLINNYGTG